MTTAAQLANKLGVISPTWTTLILVEGTYSGDFASYIQGTADQPITIKAATGARVIIDGSLIIVGQHTVWQDIEMTYSGWTTRRTEQTGSIPSDLPIDKTLIVNGANTTIRRWQIHDLAGVGSNGAAAVWEDNHISHIGWDAPDRGHGHALYIQNSGARCYVRRNIMNGCYGFGEHGYTEGGHIDYITTEDNTSYGASSPIERNSNNYLVGGYQVAKSPEFRRNLSYGAAGVNIGYAAGATDVVLVDNIAPDGITLVNCTFAEQSGSVTTVDELTVKVVQTSYGAIVTIYNPDAHDTVTVNVSAVLAAGAPYRLRNSQDYYGDVVTGNVAGDGTIEIDMRAVSHSVTQIVAGTAEATVFPAFGAFTIEAA